MRHGERPRRLGEKRNPARLTGAVNTTGKILRAPLAASTTQQIASGTIYWCYLGFRPAGEIVRHVRCGISIAGAGSQAAEVAIATSAAAPADAALTLTKVWADGTVDSLISGTGIRGNTTANTIPLPVDGHVWAGFRCAMTGGGASQPTGHILQRDWGNGMLAQTAGAAALTGSTSWTATPVTFGNSTSLDVRGYL